MIIEGKVTTLNLNEFKTLPPNLVALGCASSGKTASYYGVTHNRRVDPEYYKVKEFPKVEGYSYFIKTIDWYKYTCKLKDILV